jgi:ribose transport system substrate-binding protein
MKSKLREVSTPRLALLSLALIALAMFASACGGGGGSSSSGSSGSSGGSTSTSTEGKVKLGALMSITGIPFSTELSEGAEAGAEVVGAEMQIAGPPNIDPTVAIKQFEDMVASKPGGVAVFPIPPEIWGPPSKRAVEAGVKVASLNVPPVEGSEVPLFVGMKEKQAGEQLAHAFVEELGSNASGQIVLGIGVPGEPTNENRIYGFEAEIEKEMPNVEIVGPLTTSTEPIEALNAWAQIFQKYPNALAYLGNTDSDCSALSKLKKEGMGKGVLVGAFDPSVENGCLPAIEEGFVLAALYQQPYLQGYVVSRILGEAVKAGEELPEGWIDTGSVLVDKENAKEISQSLSSPQERAAYFKPKIEKIFANGLSGLPLKPLSEGALESGSEG